LLVDAHVLSRRMTQAIVTQAIAEPCGRGIVEAEPCPRELGREIEPRRRRIVLAACVLASSMAFIDGSALTVALPRLRAAFDADLASVQWVLNGYALALAALTLIGGALADHYGKTRMLVVGCLGFGLASAGCVVVPSLAWLIAARAAQGIAAAILTPSSLALIGATFPKDERNRAVGTWAAASALTTAGGPILGGWLTDTLGWQWIFAINPPLAVIAIVLLLAYAPPDRREIRRFDLPGAAILAAALGALAWGLSEIGSVETAAANGGTAAAAALLGAAALAGYAFRERLSAHPMTPPRLISNRAFVGLNIATLLLYAALPMMFFLLSFDLVDRRALTPTEAGFAFLPFTLAVGLLSPAFGALADKAGAAKVLIAGELCAALSLLLMGFGRDAALTTGFIGPMTLLGISFALLVTPLTASVLSSVSDADEGLASGINNALSRVAQLAGVALAAGVASFTEGYLVGFIIAAAFALGAAGITAATLPPGIHQTGR
jgi:EmrB/QacA subfamily drug resistance transporter